MAVATPQVKAAAAAPRPPPPPLPNERMTVECGGTWVWRTRWMNAFFTTFRDEQGVSGRATRRVEEESSNLLNSTTCLTVRSRFLNKALTG